MSIFRNLLTPALRMCCVLCTSLSLTVKECVHFHFTSRIPVIPKHSNCLWNYKDNDRVLMNMDLEEGKKKEL